MRLQACEWMHASFYNAESDVFKLFHLVLHVQSQGLEGSCIVCRGVEGSKILSDYGILVGVGIFRKEGRGKRTFGEATSPSS